MRAPVTGLLLPLVAGLVLRVWYFLDLARHVSYNNPIVDSLTYDGLAREILAGGGGELFFRPPLYPAVLAALYAVAGPGQGAVAALQFILGLATILPAYFLARRLLGAGAASLTAWILALYPLRIFFEGEILAVTLFGFLFMLGIWLAWVGTEEHSRSALFLAGITLGLSALARPTVLLVLPAVAAGGIAALPRERRPPARVWALFFAGALLAVAPATVHNARAERAFIPVAANGGVNFYLGNQPGSSGETPLPPGLKWQALIQEPLRLGLYSLSEQDRYWWKKARAVIVHDPAGSIRLLGRKMRLFWSAYESSNNKSLPYFTALSPVSRPYRFWFGVLCSLVAAFLVGRPPRPAALYLISIAAAYSLATALFFVTARYRLPLVPILAMLAASAVDRFFGSLRDGEMARPALMALTFLTAAALLLPAASGAGGRSIDPGFQMGQIHLSRGEPEKARLYLLPALGRNPHDPDLHNSMGAVSSAAADWEEAERHYRRALEAGDFSEVYYNLGLTYEKMGTRPKDAVAAYRRALAINPLEGRARVNLQYLLGESPD